MKVTEQFEKEITPFFWIEHEESASVCLNVGEYYKRFLILVRMKDLRGTVMIGGV